jgi:iron complex outermembrane receptor protein
MTHKKVALFGAAATIALFGAGHVAMAADAAVAAGPSTVTEVVVTANKRQENIQNVGMSIKAASGDQLTKMGIHDTESLSKIVPGFQFTPTYYGTNVFTIRGVGFQDTSLAGSPTVSVYVDEMPLPFSALTNGATLDLQRVEVLKGPQGTLFGNNATGGAINYIANKPTDTFQAGADFSYGTFNDADISGYVSGPIADGLDARLALRHDESGAWQKSYGPQPSESTGGKDFTNGRFSLLWKPNDRFKALLSLSGWQDKGYNQDGQLFGIAELSGLNALAPAIANYPLAPHNDQAANFNNCVNVDPFDPIAGQAAGTTYGTIANPGPNAVPGGQRESEGAGSVVQAGGQPTHCVPARKNNTYYSASLRLDYDLGHDITLTSLTEYQKFNRTAGIDGAGMNIQDYQSYQRGKIESAYQEVRLSGKWWSGKGSWIVGANYENDNTWDSFLQTYNASSASPTVFVNPNYLGVGNFPVTAYNVLPNSTSVNGTNGLPCGTVGTLGPYAGIFCPASTGNTALALGPTRPEDRQLTNTYAVYASGEYPILDNLTLLGGVRYTEEDKKGGVCGNDGGDGTWSQVAYTLQSFYDPPSQSAPNAGDNAAAASPAGTCASTGPGPTYNTPGLGVGGGNGLIYSHLNQHNVSWRAGLNWKPTHDTLLYVNISQGYKGGSYPTVALASEVQTKPVVQEELLSYEVGFKTELFDHQLQANGAIFYYDYTNKQILGAVADAVYGALPSLVNVPKSDVKGFELSFVYTPEWLHGLTITPSVSYQYTEIDKSSKNTCAPPPAQTPSISGNASEVQPGQVDSHGNYLGIGENTANEAIPGAPSVPGQIHCKAGDFYGFDAYGEYADFTGEKFPSAPVWQANIDAEYDWKIRDDITAFVGLNYAYVSGTNSFFVNRNPTPAFLSIGVNGPYPYFAGYVNAAGQVVANPVGPLPTNHPNDPLNVPGYGLLDLRAGVSKDAWRFQVWGRNVTNQWYWTGAAHVNDVLLRYTGMPATVGFTVTYKYH